MIKESIGKKKSVQNNFWTLFLSGCGSIARHMLIMHSFLVSILRLLGDGLLLGLLAGVIELGRFVCRADCFE
jgi:hypothetical protein